ncbi:MAG: hypothetical protein SVR94_19930, partial [Pseudomonadota bacterium]|nr:hypothetical protein [Pseudomonadota bacterium]
MFYSLTKYISPVILPFTAIYLFLFGIDYSEIVGINVGNGIAPNPMKKELLISGPSEEVDKKTGKPFYKIYSLNFENGKWCCQHEVPFSSKFNDYHPVFSPDGDWIYFNSDRPIPGKNNKSAKINIWRFNYSKKKWADPEYLSSINSSNHESYPSLTQEGTLYFNSDRPGGKGSMDIYKSELKDGEFSKPIPIEELNTTDSENDLAVDPQERFLIFNRYLFADKEIELFISYNKGGIWTEAEPLAQINKKG